MKLQLTLLFFLISTLSISVITAQTVNISGIIETPFYELITGPVTVTLTGPSNTYTFTGNGSYYFENIPANQTYELTATSDINYLNGVTSFDLVLIAEHILGNQVFDSQKELIAADVNESGDVTMIDYMIIRSLILNTISAFPNGKSWAFVPEQSQISDFSNPNIAVDITAIKLGDVNGSAIP